MHTTHTTHTGKLYFFRYTFDAQPFATAGVLDANGDLEAQFPLDLPRPVMSECTVCVLCETLNVW